MRSRGTPPQNLFMAEHGHKNNRLTGGDEKFIAKLFFPDFDLIKIGVCSGNPEIFTIPCYTGSF